MEKEKYIKHPKPDHSALVILMTSVSVRTFMSPGSSVSMVL